MPLGTVGVGGALILILVGWTDLCWI